MREQPAAPQTWLFIQQPGRPARGGAWASWVFLILSLAAACLHGFARMDGRNAVSAAFFLMFFFCGCSVFAALVSWRNAYARVSGTLAAALLILALSFLGILFTTRRVRHLRSEVKQLKFERDRALANYRRVLTFYRPGGGHSPVLKFNNRSRP